MVCEKNAVFFLAELLMNAAVRALITISLGITRHGEVVYRLVRLANRAFHKRVCTNIRETVGARYRL